jgi:hypothetical protein
MIVDEGVIVEIVRPGTGDPVAEGEVGEVVVTTLNPDYPLIRFATGDLSAVLPGESPCGRTNMRIKGWMGRADQTTKIKGMFVRPEQVAEFVARHDEVAKARVIATREGEKDVMTVQVEAPGADVEALRERRRGAETARAGGDRGAGQPAQRWQGDRRSADLRDRLSAAPTARRASGRIRGVMASRVSLDPGLGGDEFVRRGESVAVAIHPTEGDAIEPGALHVDGDAPTAGGHVAHERREFLERETAAGIRVGGVEGACVGARRVSGVEQQGEGDEDGACHGGHFGRESLAIGYRRRRFFEPRQTQ